MKTYTPTKLRKNILKIMNKNNEPIRISMFNRYHNHKHDWCLMPMKDFKSFYVWQEKNGLHHLIHEAEDMKSESERKFKHNIRP